MDDLKKILIDRVLPDAYAARPGRPDPRYNKTQAQQALAVLARQMNQHHTRDLTWWQIPQWTPAIPRILVTWLVVALVGEVALGLTQLIPPYPTGLREALKYGLHFGLPIAFAAWLAGLLTAGVAGRLASSVAVALRDGEPRRQARTINWRAFRSRPVLLIAFTLGLVVTTLVGVAYASDSTSNPGFGFGFKLVEGLVGASVLLGLPMAFVTWLAVGLAVGLTGTGTSRGSPLSPRESWAHNRMVGLAGGLVFGLAIAAAVFGLVIWLYRLPPSPSELTFALVSGLEYGLGFGVAVGLSFWLGVSQIWQTTLAWLQLQRSYRIHFVALMPFLEDAHARGVLRTVGAVYQFRHATLQDRLAEQTTSTAPSSSTAQRTS